MKSCPECGGIKVKELDADSDWCEECYKYFPTVPEVEEVYCHACSVAGGADRAIYHTGAPCKDGVPK